jgi:glycosyltransferase involved in cell wall biosynthesis
MRLHILGIPHTVTRSDFSHCAFTGKVQRFAPMMRAQGFDVVHYGAEGSTSGATLNVDVLSTEEHLDALGLVRYHQHAGRFIGNDARVDAPVYRIFNFALREALKEHLEDGDVICLPFGFAHDASWQGLPIVEESRVHIIETGIGYPEPIVLNRVYESQAWRHWMMGRDKRDGHAWMSHRKEWVVPNYYDPAEWPEGDGSLDTVVYLGRICDSKGCDIIPLIAAAYPMLKFVLCGQGDPAPYLTQPNISYREPVHGMERAKFLGSALCSLHPSRFVEPFCGAAVEAMLCGTPVVTSDFGAFTETVQHGTTGYRARTLQQFIDGIELCSRLSRSATRSYARSRYSMSAVGPLYTEVFGELTASK